MFSRTRFVLPLLGLLALSGCGLFGPSRPPHWSPNARPRDENWHSPAAALLKYDTNRDGTLTRAELLAGLKAEFDTYDVNHNNCLGPDQVRAINQLRVKEDASQASPLVDWNQDNCIDFNEYSGATMSLFDTLDVNGDGELSAKELNPTGRTGQPAAAGQGTGRGRGGHHHGGGGGEPPGQ
jgi:hypothetical protein